MEELMLFGKSIGSMLSFVKSRDVIKKMKKDELQKFTLGLFETIYRSEKTKRSLIFDEGWKIKTLLTEIDNKLDLLEELTDGEDYDKFKSGWLEDDANRVLKRIHKLRSGGKKDYIDM